MGLSKHGHHWGEVQALTAHQPVTASEDSSPDRRWYRFGDYVVDAPKRLLWRDRILVPITSKAFEILLLLIQRRGRVVEKQELMEAVWPKTAVEENTLTRHISTLRKVLDERPDQHTYILTVPGHGYQFVAEVVELQDRPDYLRHSLKAPIPKRETAAIERDAAEPAGRVEEITDRAPGGAVAPAASSRRFSWTSSGVAAAAGIGLAAATTALVFAVLRADGPRPASTSRNLRQITFLGGVQKDPTWSPDGRQVAYASEHAGNTDLFIQAIGEPAPRQLTSSKAEDSQPDWSSDGQSLVFRSEAEGGGIFVVPARGGTPRKIASFGFHPRWSPSGTHVLFSSAGHGGGGNARFYVVSVDGAPPARLRPDLLADIRPMHVAWRPDGQISVWGRRPDGTRVFLTAPVHAGVAIESAIAPAVDERRQEAGLTLDRFVWSPSGRHLYFEGRAEQTGSLWRITVDPKTLAWTDGPDRLTTGTTKDSDPAVSPDARRLVFSARSARTRLWMFPFDAASGKVTGPGQPVTSGAAGELDADVPDDGSKLVYRTVRGATQQVWERTVSDGRERLLVEGDDWVRTRPRWSSDGRWLSYLKRRPASAGSSGDATVALLAVARGEEILLTRPGTPEVVPTDWSPDGKSLIGGCPRGEPRTVGTCMVQVIPGKPTDAVQVLASDRNHNLFEQRFSPDQRWISFIAVNATDAGASTVFLMPAAGGPWRAVTDGSTYDDKPHWAPDGRTLYFVSHRDAVLNVWGRRIEPDGTPTGSIFQVTSFNTPRQMISTQLGRMQIALTNDRLFLPITDTESELWMLENVDR